MLRLAGVVVCVCVLGPAGRADETANQARLHYQKANNSFAVGEFATAADEYELAYKAKPDAALLFNAAQARRLAGENQKALTLYRNYSSFYPKAKNLAEVREQIAKLQDAIAAAEKAKTAPPMNTVEMGKSQEQHETAQKEQPPTPQQQKEPDRPTPVYKKWWLWTAVGGGVVVITLAIVLPIVLQPPPWNNLPNQGPGAALTAGPHVVRTAPVLEVRW